MLEVFGNIWDLAKDYDAIVITTNGYVKKSGEAVMGRGIAKEAAERNPWLPSSLGHMLKHYGNDVYNFGIVPSFAREGSKQYDQTLYTFPVKPEFGPNGEMGWKARAQLPLIVRSCVQLVKQIDQYGYRKNYKVLMPRPGCGNGGLKWEDVKPVIEPLLDDRFTVCTFEPL